MDPSLFFAAVGIFHLPDSGNHNVIEVFTARSDATFWYAFERGELALDALREGRGVMVLDDDEDRETKAI